MLNQYRKKIDKIDKKIIELLGKRFEVTKKVGIYKKENNLNAYDKKREQEMFRNRTNWAKENNLEEKFIISFFKFIIKKVRENHRAIK